MKYVLEVTYFIPIEGPVAKADDVSSAVRVKAEVIPSGKFSLDGQPSKSVKVHKKGE